MKAIDSSVAIPALAAWHESHESCRRAAFGAWTPAHVLIEVYSVLTRIPAPHRLAPETAASLVDGNFANDRIIFPSDDLVRSLARLCAAAGVAGGAAYDALIGSTAAERDALLLTLDRRAIRTYERIGVRSEFIGD